MGKKVKLEIEFDGDITDVTRQWLLVDITSFMRYKWKAFETVTGNREETQVRFIEE